MSAHALTHTNAADIWCVFWSCFLFSFYRRSQQLKETETERWRTLCSPCGHNSVATCLHQRGNCLTFFISAWKDASITTLPCVCVSRGSQASCSIFCWRDFHGCSIHQLPAESTLGKVLKSIKALKASQFTPVSVLSFRGAVLVDLLNNTFLFLHADRRDKTAKKKQKFLFSNTSGGRPLSSTSSCSFSLLYLSHNPLIKVQIKERLCSSLWPSISP